jgi:signal transduction histidine kinase
MSDGTGGDSRHTAGEDDTSALADPRRLAALAETRLLDSPAEEAFERFTRLTVRLLDVPVALVSLVDDRRQFFKSALGVEEPWASRRGTPLSHSFCQHVVTSDEPLRVDDAVHDERVRDNLAIEDLGVVAYLGAPIRTPDGETLGTLCAIDEVPREWTVEDLAVLRDLAANVSTEIALRLQAERLDAFARRVSHQLRTPLTALRVRTEGVALWPDLDREVRTELHGMLQELGRLWETVETHLELARSGRSGHETELDLGDVLAAARDRWTDGARDRGRDLVVRADEPVRAVLPAGALTQVLDVLVENALEHGDGAITLEQVIEPSVVRLRVTDEGPTVPVPQASRWFTEGVRGPRSSGRGMGLPLAQELARSIGAHLALAATDATGFDLILPPSATVPASTG